MSFTDAYDNRFALAFCEVHYWGDRGRIMIINKDAHRPVPMVTELNVNVGAAQTGNATFAVALALTDSAIPQAVLFSHIGNRVDDIDVTPYRRMHESTMGAIMP